MVITFQSEITMDHEKFCMMKENGHAVLRRSDGKFMFQMRMPCGKLTPIQVGFAREWIVQRIQVDVIFLILAVLDGGKFDRAY